MESFSMTSNYQKSGPPTGSQPRHHRKGEENMYTIRSNKAKSEQLIFSKTYPIKMVINNRFLDMQVYKKVYLTQQRLKIDPYFQ
jgi:hypothetical protein